MRRRDVLKMLPPLAALPALRPAPRLKITDVRVVPLKFLWMLQEGVYDILQPEVLVDESITGLRKIAALAEAFGKRVAPPHGGGNIGVMAQFHLIASWPRAPYIELLHDPPIGSYRHRFSILEDPPLVDKEGCVSLPQGPGLGVAIRRELVAYQNFCS